MINHMAKAVRDREGLAMSLKTISTNHLRRLMLCAVVIVAVVGPMQAQDHPPAAADHPAGDVETTASSG